MSGSSEKQNQFSCLYLSFYLFTFPLSKSQVDLCSILTSIYHELMGNEEFGIMTRRGLNQSMQHLQHLFWHLVLSLLAIKDSRKTYCPFAERRKFLSSLGESGTLSLVPSSESVFFFFSSMMLYTWGLWIIGTILDSLHIASSGMDFIWWISVLSLDNSDTILHLKYCDYMRILFW